MTKTTTVAFTVIAALALGACSKRNAGSLRARANYAKETGDKGEAKSVNRTADQEIDASIDKLHDLGYQSIGRGMMGAISTKLLFGNVKPADRTEVKRLLNKIVSLAESQITAAQALNDNDDKKGKIESAERVRANAQIGLDQIAKEEQEDKK